MSENQKVEKDGFDLEALEAKIQALVPGYGTTVKKVVAELTGQDGNAFAVMGRAKRALDKAGRRELSAILFAECTKGDYDALLCATMAFVDDGDPDAEREDDEDEMDDSDEDEDEDSDEDSE